MVFEGRDAAGKGGAIKRMLVEDGITLVKYWFSVSDDPLGPARTRRRCCGTTTSGHRPAVWDPGLSGPAKTQCQGPSCLSFSLSASATVRQAAQWGVISAKWPPWVSSR